MDSSLDAARNASLCRYLPMFDPDHFDDVAFFQELEAIGYRQVLIGGTGAGRTPRLVADIRAGTTLEVILVPGGPAAVTQADLIVLPDVMNTNSHFARPFGSGSVATASATAELGIPFLPVAYFIQGRSTAAWYYDAFPLPSDKVLLGLARYARMLGYRHLALDYEDPEVEVPLPLIAALRGLGMHLVVSDEFSARRARHALAAGADTIVTPSNVYEQARDPLGLAKEMFAALIAGPPKRPVRGRTPPSGPDFRPRTIRIARSEIGVADVPEPDNLRPPRHLERCPSG